MDDQEGLVEWKEGSANDWSSILLLHFFFLTAIVLFFISFFVIFQVKYLNITKTIVHPKMKNCHHLFTLMLFRPVWLSLSLFCGTSLLKKKYYLFRSLSLSLSCSLLFSLYIYMYIFIYLFCGTSLIIYIGTANCVLITHELCGIFDWAKVKLLQIFFRYTLNTLHLKTDSIQRSYNHS